MSASFVGGSSAGSSSGASSSGVHGGSSALTMSILSSVAMAGENQLLGSSAPSLAARPYATPISSPTVVAGLGGSSMTTWIVLIVVALVGIFAWREL